MHINEHHNFIIALKNKSSKDNIYPDIKSYKLFIAKSILTRKWEEISLPNFNTYYMYSNQDYVGGQIYKSRE